MRGRKIEVKQINHEVTKGRSVVWSQEPFRAFVASWFDLFLDMNRAFFDGQRRFFDGFRQGRVRVEGAGEVFAGGVEFHRHDRFGDHVARMGGEDVDAEDAIGFGVGDDLDLAIGFVHAAGAAIGGEREFADLDLPLLSASSSVSPTDASSGCV